MLHWKHLRNLVVVAIVLVCPVLAGASALDERLEILEDPDNQFSIEQVSGSLSGRFVALERRPALNLTRATYWLRFQPGPETGDRYLLKSWSLDQQAEVFRPQPAGGWERITLVNGQPSSARQLPVRDLIVPVGDAGQSPWYLRMRDRGAPNPRLHLMTFEQLLARVQKAWLVDGLLAGALGLMLMVHIMFCWGARDCAGAWLMAFLACHLSVVIMLSGAGSEFAARWMPGFPQAMPVLLVAAMAMLAGHTQVFLGEVHREPRNSPRREGLRRLSFVLLVCAGGLALVPGTLAWPLATPVLTAAILMLLGVGLHSLFTRGPRARSCMLAWALYIAGILAFAAHHFGILDGDSSATWGLHLGALLASVTFTYATGGRLRRITGRSRRARENVREAAHAHVLELERLNEEKTAFMHWLRHQIRQPMATLREAKHAAELDGVSWTLRERLLGLRSGVEQMDRLLETTLRYFALVTRAHLPPTARVSPYLIIKHVLRDESLRRRMRARSVDLVNELQPGLLVEANNRELSEVFSMLIDNVLDHCPAGVTVRTHARLEPSGKAVLCIDDDGQGLPENEVAELLRPFFSRERVGGQARLGLSLSMALAMVEQMGGAMWAETTPAGGLGIRIRLTMTAPGPRQTLSSAPLSLPETPVRPASAATSAVPPGATVP